MAFRPIDTKNTMQKTAPESILAQLEAALPGKDDFASGHSHPELFRAIFDELIEQIDPAPACSIFSPRQTPPQ